MKKTKEMMTVTGATRRQLQFYNNRGLIDTRRTEDNHRLYNQECMEELWKIFIYKQVGFTLEEIKSLKRMKPVEREEFLSKKVDELYFQQRKNSGKAELIKDILKKGFPEKPTDEEMERGVTYIQKAEGYLQNYMEKGREKK